MRFAALPKALNGEFAVVDAQAEFDEKYITSTELCRELVVTRATLVNGRRRGALPEPVRIDRPDGSPHVMIWIREEVAPFVTAWKAELAARRGEVAPA